MSFQPDVAPDFHEPTIFPPKTSTAPLSLAEMPDSWFNDTPQANIIESGESVVVPVEIDDWVGVSTARYHAAERRLSRTPEEVREPVDERTQSKSKLPSIWFLNQAVGNRVGRTISRDDSADRAQEKFGKAISETLRTLPYAKGANTRVTPEEAQIAERVMQSRKHNGHYVAD